MKIFYWFLDLFICQCMNGRASWINRIERKRTVLDEIFFWIFSRDMTKKMFSNDSENILFAWGQMTRKYLHIRAVHISNVFNIYLPMIKMDILVYCIAESINLSWKKHFDHNFFLANLGFRTNIEYYQNILQTWFMKWWFLDICLSYEN